MQQRPHTVLSHDGPTYATYQLFLKGKDTYQKMNRTNEALQRMFEAWQPQRWFFGHWHETKHQKLDTCHFQCIGKRDYLDVDW